MRAVDSHGPPMETNADEIDTVLETPSRLPDVLDRRIVVAVDDDRGMRADVSRHFGRCPFYTLVEVMGSRITASKTIENPYYQTIGQPGLIPGFVRDLGAHAIIAGSVGGRAMKCFEDFGIDVVTPVMGKVKEVVEGYARGEIRGIASHSR